MSAISFFAFLSFLLIPLASPSASPTESFPRLDLEMTGAEWMRLRASMPQLFEAAGKLQPALDLGQRNLQWLAHMNDRRTEKISLTDRASSSGGIPVEQPREYSEQTIHDAYLGLLGAMPEPMRRVLVAREPFTDEPGLSVDDYILWGRKIDNVYQYASRWILLAPYLSQMKDAQASDIRGFYFLMRETDRDRKLDEFASLSSDERAKYETWLGMICVNSGAQADSCRQELTAAAAADRVNEFYLKYINAAEANWRRYFEIPRGFTGLDWPRSRPLLAEVPFVSDSETIMTFLKTNIQDEWRWGDWKLELRFTPKASEAVRVVWQAGVTPHVPDYGASVIYMDANAPLTEYDVQWTIRHEFGHVLGFPDCYLEFYDETKKVIVSYQFDVTDLMCSRAGKFKERHFRELQRHYFPTAN